jgi:hypothetical protein
MSGQEVVRSDISAVSNAERCEITTSSAHGLSTDQFIRVTDLNGMIPVNRGQTQINNQRFKVYVTSTTTFYLRDPITSSYINSTNYTPYVEGGSVNLFQTQYQYEGDS